MTMAAVQTNKAGRRRLANDRPASGQLHGAHGERSHNLHDRMPRINCCKAAPFSTEETSVLAVIA